MGFEPATRSLGSPSSTACLAVVLGTNPKGTRWNPLEAAAPRRRLARVWRADGRETVRPGCGRTSTGAARESTRGRPVTPRIAARSSLIPVPVAITSARGGQAAGRRNPHLTKDALVDRRHLHRRLGVVPRVARSPDPGRTAEPCITETVIDTPRPQFADIFRSSSSIGPT